MKTAWIAAITVLTVMLTSGCGTVLNLTSGDPDVYGGIRKDVNFMMTPPKDRNEMSSGSGGGYFALVVVADAGLSAIADTLTLPVVVRMRRNEHNGDDKVGSAGREAGKPIDPAVEGVFLEKPRRLDGSSAEGGRLDGEANGSGYVERRNCK